jgi:hypothetical protein
LALDSLKRSADIDLDRSPFSLDLRSLLEIAFGLVRTAQFRIRKSAEVVTAWITTALLDGHREQFVSLIVLASVIGVHALPVQFQQQAVLSPSCRGGQPEEHQGNASVE